ncbi:hypothetical protein ICN84_10040 [Akkermansia glycaniphila]|uniref:hypothetical protein n=1 Tax=Akkermansia glycaniphila TaxID=1679444 RepID=UPI001C039BCF|nr:hypothetical protein [Akkermansia glycaniphila]MBT9450407.1 hypothetical protein [Akkermansia glycaniphila]
MPLARTLLPALALLLSGCWGDPHYESCNMLEKKPQPEDIVGTWNSSKDSFKTSWCPPSLKNQLQTHPMQLTFSKDGTFLYRNYSTEKSYSPVTWSKPEDIRGTWAIYTSIPGSGSTSYGVNLNFRKNGTNETVSASFYGKRPNCLIFTHGDPDSGEAYFLDKTK